MCQLQTERNTLAQWKHFNHLTSSVDLSQTRPRDASKAFEAMKKSFPYVMDMSMWLWEKDVDSEQWRNA